ncbi:MAG: molybdopterin cofactor-binding domain-containing protein [Halioglobus sp.]
MSVINSLSRRQFLELAGVSTTGLLLSASLSGMDAQAARLDDSSAYSLNLFVSVQKNGAVEVIAHRSEMGTGIRTSLPQVLADEMGADWQQVKVVQGLGNKEYGSQNTDGSRSVRDFYHVMRQLGASARSLLEQAAAKSWGVPVAECRADNHRVVHSSGKALGFGELVETASQLPAPNLDSLKLKDSSDFNYIGHSLPIVDLEDMTTGNTVFGVDVHLPGMLYASIERAPSLDARIKSYDKKAPGEIAGVVDVLEIEGKPLPSSFNPLEGIAVIASNSWSAMKGREALNARWTVSEHASHQSTEYLEELAERVAGGPGEVARGKGDVTAALATNHRQIEAVYKTPYLAHASMEPPMATAHLHDGLCEVWACTQTPQSAQREVAKALGLELEAVKVHVTLLGGGFGRKSKPDFIVEAALLARELAKPVQVTWTREDDIRHDYFHSCSAQYYQGALDDENKVVAWLAREATPPIASLNKLGANMMSDGALSQTFGSIPFDIPNLRIERHEADAHARIGWMRSVYNIPFAFGVGSFVDELAALGQQNPMDFWLDLLGEDRQLDFADEKFKLSNYGRSLEDYPYETGRFKQVIRELRQKCAWDDPLPAKQGWGMTAIRSFLSYVAVATKVEVSDGKLSVLEMHCVMDCGTVVNPDRVHAQMEGAMIFGLSLALMGEISFTDGVADQSNFHDYPVARINQTPAIIRTHIVDSDALPAGVGEPGVPPVAPSIANAIFAASGQRLRELPLNRHLKV